MNFSDDESGTRLPEPTPSQRFEDGVNYMQIVQQLRKRPAPLPSPDTQTSVVPAGVVRGKDGRPILITG